MINISWKRVLVWSFVAGVGFTIGAVLVRLAVWLLNWGLALDQIPAWLAGG